MMTPADLQLCVDLRWGYVQYPCIVEPKIDGFRCLVTVDTDGMVHAWSRSGREWPAVADALAELSQFPGAWFDGELVIGGSWASTNAAKNAGWKFDADDLLFLYWHTTAQGGFIRHHKTHRIRRIAANLCQNRADVEQFYRAAVAAGYEGIVIKKERPYTPGRSGNWQRLKPRMTEDVPQADGSIHEMYRGECVRVRTGE